MWVSFFIGLVFVGDDILVRFVTFMLRSIIRQWLCAVKKEPRSGSTDRVRRGSFLRRNMFGDVRGVAIRRGRSCRIGRR